MQSVVMRVEVEDKNAAVAEVLETVAAVVSESLLPLQPGEPAGLLEASRGDAVRTGGGGGGR